MQSHLQSLREATVQTAIGFGISYEILAYGLRHHWAAIEITCAVTVASLARQYFTRRFFNGGT